MWEKNVITDWNKSPAQRGVRTDSLIDHKKETEGRKLVKVLFQSVVIRLWMIGGRVLRFESYFFLLQQLHTYKDSFLGSRIPHPPFFVLCG